MHKIEFLHFQDTWKVIECHTPKVLIGGLIMGRNKKTSRFSQPVFLFYFLNHFLNRSGIQMVISVH
jgi:hypothetical protein